MNVNLDDYESVKSRKAKFYKDYPKGSITVELLNLESINTHAVFKASVFESKEDQEKNLPRGIGYALEVRDKEKKVSNSGKEYESVNYTSWTENCEESAVGRALDNAGYSGNKKASREEMVKAQTHAEVFSKETEDPDWVKGEETKQLPEDKKVCMAHEEPIQMFQGKSKTKFNDDGTPKTYWWHSDPAEGMCFGSGYKS